MRKFIRGLMGHAEQRATERYGLRLGWAGVLEIQNLIGTSDSIFVQQRPTKGNLWVVLYKGTLLKVVAGRGRTLLTILPPYKETSKNFLCLRDRIIIVILAVMNVFKNEKIV